MTTSVYWSGVFEQFVSYFACYAPWLPDAIKGAPADRVAHVEALAGASFPPEYRAFLSIMGSTPKGTLDPFLQYENFGISTLEAFYRLPGLRAPRDAVFLWTYDCDTPYDIFIETKGAERDIRELLQAGWALDENTGALLDEEPTLVRLGGSLMRSLYFDAFLRLRDPLLTESIELRDRVWSDKSKTTQLRLRTAFRSVAEQLGFEAVPFLDADQIFYNRADASLELFAHPGANIVYVQSNDRRELGHLSEVLADNLSLAIRR